MFGALHDRLDRWWLARHPPRDRVVLTQRNVYILPTRAGIAFGATLLVMLVTAINYQLNLGYLVTFLLAGAGLASLLFTHATLRGLVLQLRPPQPGFVGEALRYEIVLESPDSRRHGIGVGPARHAERDVQAWLDVPAHGQAGAVLSVVPKQRGEHPLPRLCVQTRFPFGLFRAWALWQPSTPLLAWPAPENPAQPLPTAQPLGAPLAGARRADAGELDGVRAYRRGDPLRRIVWKKAAKTGELVTRESAQAASQQLWLDWRSAAGGGGADVETRLSRLAAWVLAAERDGVWHGLRLPGVELAPGLGDAHRLRALRELATWQ